MRPWPFDHGNSPWWPLVTPAPSSFNEAMTFRSWKSRWGRLKPWIGMRSLQWGHDLSIMEIETHVHAWPGHRDRFNEAMTFRSWKSSQQGTIMTASKLLQWGHDLSIMEMTFLTWNQIEMYSASMRPWPFDHGNLGFKSSSVQAFEASMRPWPFDHGNCHLRWGCLSNLLASMRPWPFDHGNRIGKYFR